MKKSNIAFLIIQVLVDTAMIYLALFSAFLIRTDGQTSIYRWTLNDYSHLAIISLPIWILIFFTQGLYRTKQPLRGLSEISAIVVATLSSWAIYVVGLYFYRSESTMVLPRLILIYSLFLSFIYVIVTRQILHIIQRALYRVGIGVRQLILIGSNNSITNYINSQLKNKKHGYNIAKICSEDDLEINNIPAIFGKQKIDEVIVSTHNISDNKLLPLLEYCENHNIIYKMIPNIFEVHASHAHNMTFLGIPVVELVYTPLQGWGRIIKRLVDIIGSLFALIILSPVMILTALLVKIESKGPVFYHHERIGQNGKHFYLLKFRSMNEDADDELKRILQTDPILKREFQTDFKLKNDPRVTRVGKFIRKISLDEIPQFFNVLAGGMSLVGPRPIIDTEMEKYGIYKNKRHIIRPGVTGMWQVSGRNDVAYDERIRLDSYYIENWSFWLDISIIFKTMFTIFKKNAY